MDTSDILSFDPGTTDEHGETWNLTTGKESYAYRN
jgi:hypothetical protein